MFCENRFTPLDSTYYSFVFRVSFYAPFRMALVIKLLYVFNIQGMIHMNLS